MGNFKFITLVFFNFLWVAPAFCRSSPFGLNNFSKVFSNARGFSKKPHSFDLEFLSPSAGKNIVICLIDEKVTQEKLCLGFNFFEHGVNSKLLLSGVRSPCRNSTVHVIGALNSYGICRKRDLILAVKKALLLKADILVLALKICDFDPNLPLSKELEQLLSRFPYVVTASGNSGSDKLAYPGRCLSTTFSVGSFGIKNNCAYISDFSQYEKGLGPDFLSLGEIFIPSKKNFILRGTSYAAVTFAGLLATILAEFRNIFSKEQIISVLRKSGIKLGGPGWEEKSLNGALDVKKSLFIFRALSRVKEIYSRKSVKKFDQEFADLLAKLELLLRQSKTKKEFKQRCFLQEHGFLKGVCKF